MLATELKKANFKQALQILVEDFNAHNIEHSEGGRMGFWIPDVNGEDICGEISRDCDVCFFDNSEIEDKINQTIQELQLDIHLLVIHQSSSQLVPNYLPKWFP